MSHTFIFLVGMCNRSKKSHLNTVNHALFCLGGALVAQHLCEFIYEFLVSFSKPVPNLEGNGCSSLLDLSDWASFNTVLPVYDLHFRRYVSVPGNVYSP